MRVSRISAVWRRGVFNTPLVRHLGLVLLAKVLVLFLLWFAFFHDPARQPPSAADISAALLGADPAASGGGSRHCVDC